MAYSRKDRLVQKISKHANIRQDVVEIVVEAMVDVIVDEVVNKGKFSFFGLFQVKSKDWKGYSFGNGQAVGNHQRLSVSLSKHLKELWKIRFNELDGADDVIDKDNWKEVYRHYGLKPRKKSPSSISDKQPSSAKHSRREEPVKNEVEPLMPYNPFLDDDDEDEF